MATKIIVNKPDAMKNLREMVDHYGKRIKRAKSENTRTLLAGRIEGAIEALELAGIVTETDKVILKVYFDNNYGREA